MNIPVNEYSCDGCEDTEWGQSVADQPGFRHEVNQSAKIQKDENHHQIKQDEYGGRAYLVDCGRQPERDFAEEWHNVQEQEKESPEASPDYEDSPHSVQWKNHPDVPQCITKTRQGQQCHKNHFLKFSDIQKSIPDFYLGQGCKNSQ